MIRSAMTTAGARTAIGALLSSLSRFAPAELARLAAEETVRHPGIDAKEIELTVFGNPVHTGPKDMCRGRPRHRLSR